MSQVLKNIIKKMLLYVPLRNQINLKRFLISLKAKITADWFNKNFNELKRQKGTDTTFKFDRMYPILTDKYNEGGLMNGHYFHQDLYVAQLIHKAEPEKHLDIGSRTDGFVAHVASYRKIELIDIRMIKSNVKNIIFRQADLMKLPPDLIDYCDSLSSLHVIEHIGLGRYGDSIDYFGHLKAINNIAKILRNGGTFYFSVPIGPQRIEFNAHRVFSLKYLVSILSHNFTIHSFSYVDDKGDFFEDVELTEYNINSDFRCRFGCGIFTCIKNKIVENEYIQ